jgi:secreted trypsin-like serine protease
MRWWWLLCVAAPAAAGPAPILGGSNAPDGEWPDAAALQYGSDVRCSGTLVAPTVVVTAAHCTDPALTTPPDHVLVGTTSLDAGGETLAISSHVEFPDWQASEDVSVLVLATSATTAPRPIATGWASTGIVDDATVDFVGWGTTDKDGTVRTRILQQATSTITDATCSTHPQDCRVPGGELAAGGSGIDTCPGDSGGPLYLPAGFLAGVTSRGFIANTFACGEGGIYVRPDHVVDWIESVGGPVARGPEPKLDAPLEGARGALITAAIDANDPDSDAHHLAIAIQPMHASAHVADDGTLEVCVRTNAPAGSDSVVVKLTDAHDGSRSIEQAFAIAIDEADATGACDPSFGDAGCCHAGGRASLPVVLAALAILRRRR